MEFLVCLPFFLITAPKEPKWLCVYFAALMLTAFHLRRVRKRHGAPRDKSCLRVLIPLMIFCPFARQHAFFEKWSSSAQWQSLCARFSLPADSTLRAVFFTAAALNAVLLLFYLVKACPDALPKRFRQRVRAISGRLRARLTLKSALLPLCLLLIAQTVLITTFGTRKSGYHEDEIYTFLLSNYDSTQRNLQPFENRFSGEEEIADTLRAGENRFNYSMVWRNQESDVHPPLYYVLMHTLCSLFPSSCSKWLGIVPNLLFCLGTTVLLFLCAKTLFCRNGWALLAAAAWALSTGAVSSAVFLRMYAMLTFFVTLFLFLHLKHFRGQSPLRSFVPFFLCTLCGILTQYYFMIVCFFLCGFTLLWLLQKRRFRDALSYTLSQLKALALSVYVFPGMLYHIFSGYHGTKAVSNLVNGKNFFSQLKYVLKLITSQTVGKAGLLLLAAALLLPLILTVIRRLRRETLPRTAERFPFLEAAALLCVTAGYTLLVCRVSLYQADRYYICLYPLLTLLTVSVLRFAFGSRAFSLAAACAVCAVSLITTYAGGGVRYLYTETRDRTGAVSAADCGQLLLLRGTDECQIIRMIPTELKGHEVYLCDSSLEGIPADQLEDRFLLYGFQCGSEDALLSRMTECLPGYTFRLLTDQKLVHEQLISEDWFDIDCPVWLCEKNPA